MSDLYAPLRALFADAGYRFVEPPILYEASVFVDLAGEELRRRLFLADADDGTEMALRPDYTIPIALHHIEGGAAGRRADYAYLGPVFRRRPNGSGEFRQAGVESLGRSDRATADVDMLRLALQACEVLGIAGTAVRIGDSSLFGAVLDALDLAEPWRRRLSRGFGNPTRLKTLIARLGGSSEKPPAHEGFLAALDGADHAAAHRVVEDLLALAGIRTVGGRSVGEIADRFLEKAALAAGAADARTPAILARFLAIGGSPAASLKSLRALARSEKLDLGMVLDLFERRADGFADHGIDPGRLTFAADFGRRLDYYTGFVFEIHDASRPDLAQIVGGGRYDKLLGLIGGGEAAPAIGFSIWLDRVGADGATP